MINKNYTYLAYSEYRKHVKIGFSNDPSKRMKTLHTADESIRLLYILPADKYPEKDLHRRFKQYRINPKYEWFEDNPEITTYFLDQLAVLDKLKESECPFQENEVDLKTVFNQLKDLHSYKNDLTFYENDCGEYWIACISHDDFRIRITCTDPLCEGVWKLIDPHNDHYFEWLPWVMGPGEQRWLKEVIKNAQELKKKNEGDKVPTSFSATYFFLKPDIV